jgi:hypothetical protein
MARRQGILVGEMYNVTFGKNGYQDKAGTVDTELNGWYWGNFLFGGVIGLLIIDRATGAMWRLPESYHADLLEKVKTLGDASHSFRAFSINDIPLEERANLIPVK